MLFGTQRILEDINVEKMNETKVPSSNSSNNWLVGWLVSYMEKGK